MEISKPYKLTLVTLGFLCLVGVVAWIDQLINGLIVTGLRNVVPWGLYITSFMFFAGVAAGALIIASSATVFNIPIFAGVAKPAVILSTACIIVAGMFLFLDLGRPERAFNMLIHPQFRSPLVWDFVILTSYLTVSFAYIFEMIRPVPHMRKLAVLAAVALPVAVLDSSVIAWIFGLQAARVGWHSALMAPLFVASALASGLAVLLVSSIVLQRTIGYTLNTKLYATLAGLLAVFAAVDAFFVFSEVLTAAYPGEENVVANLDLLLFGSLAPFFWGHVILGDVVPFLILVRPSSRRNKSLILTASVLVAVGVYSKRIWLVMSGWLVPNIAAAPGITLGEYVRGTGPAGIPDIWAVAGTYAPTAVEWAITGGVLAFGMLLYILAVRRLLWVPTDAAHGTGAVPSVAR
jgi:dimethyl sulfoxide reductase membrane subunit